MQNENQYEETTLEDVRKQINDLNIALESLSKNCDICIGTESIGGFLKDVGNYFWDGLTNIAKAFTNFCTAPFSSPLMPELKEYDKYKNKLSRVANDKENWDLLIHSEIKVPYINGCNLPLYEVGRALDNLNKECFDIVTKAVTDVNFILSKGLSDETFRTSNRPYDTKDTFKKADKYTDEVTKANEYIITSDLHEDNRYFGDVVFYNNQVVEVEKYINNMKKNMDVKKLEQINSNVKSISAIAKELADAIDEERFGDRKSSTYPSKEFVKLVRESLVSAGKAVTAISTQFYLNTQYVRVYNFLCRNVDKYIEEAKQAKSNQN